MILTALFFATSLLYSAVGQAGGSGYLAIMAAYGLPPAEMKPTALVLNVFVAVVATGRFYRAGHFVWSRFWPFALASVPCSFLGGRVPLSPVIYRPLVGGALLYAAWKLLRAPASDPDVRPLPQGPALISGGVIGLVSGLTGIGGGIFLTPLLLSTGWASARQAAGISAVFILVNSIAGLLGHMSSMQSLPPALPLWASAAVIGGWLGAGYGSQRVNARAFRVLLVLVLIIGGLRLQFG